MSQLISLPTLTELTLSDIKPAARATTPVCAPAIADDVTWASIDVERREGETHFEPRRMVIAAPSPRQTPSLGAVNEVPFVFRAHTSLPLSDAVDLLLGIDHTGLMAWEGSRQLLKWLGWVFFGGRGGIDTPPPASAIEASASTSPAETLVVELGAGCGFLSVALTALLDASRCVVSNKQNMGHSDSPIVSPFATRLGALLFSHQYSHQQLACGRHVHVCCTDGSDECAELIRKNMVLHKSLRCKTNYAHSHCESKDIAEDSSASGAASAAAESHSSTSEKVFWWGDAAKAKEIVSTAAVVSSAARQYASSSPLAASSSDTPSSALIVIAGDVVYGEEAVEPLAKAARDLALAHEKANSSHTTGGDEAPLWVLSWMPRCLTRQQNLILFDKLLCEITSTPFSSSSSSTSEANVEAPRGWRLKEVFLRIEDGPSAAATSDGGSSGEKASVSSAMDSNIIPFDILSGDKRNADVFESCAMSGCILCLVWE